MYVGRNVIFVLKIRKLIKNKICVQAYFTECQSRNVNPGSQIQFTISFTSAYTTFLTIFSWKLIFWVALA